MKIHKINHTQELVEHTPHYIITVALASPDTRHFEQDFNYTHNHFSPTAMIPLELRRVLPHSDRE